MVSDLKLSAISGVAMQAAIGMPFAIPFASVGESFEVDLDLTTLPDRPRIFATATPDGAHGDMTLDLVVLDCDANIAYEAQFGPCPEWTAGGIPGV